MGVTQKTVGVVIVAGGKGERTGFVMPKQYVTLDGLPVLTRALEAFLCHPRVHHVVVVRQEAHAELYETALARMKDARLLPPAQAGATRQDSVRNGLEALTQHAPDYVLIHDAARPYVSQALITLMLEALDNGERAAVPVLAVTDTVKRVKDGKIVETLPRAELAAVQTPQGFAFQTILSLHRNAKDPTATDDAMLAERAGIRVGTVEGEAANRKLTIGEDMREYPVDDERQARGETRIGFGFDVHRFSPPALGAAEEENHIRLCGIDIPHTQSLEGHSDADVGLHALTDAILGAIAEGDIGTHFPAGDPQWKGADSTKFLAHAVALAAGKGAKLLHIDLTLICESPKIGPHREMMRKRLSEILHLDLSRVSIKATTTEGLGFTGRQEGIAAQAVATLKIVLLD